MQDLPWLLVALLLIALWLRLDFVFYIVYVVGGIWLLARWLTPRGLKKLAVQRHFNDHAFLGETVPVKLELHNPTRWPLGWLRVQENLPLSLAANDQLQRAYTLRARERITIDYDLRCTRRGYYPVGPLHLTGGDWFGFAPRASRDEAIQFITVYPRIIPLVGLHFDSRLPFGVLRSPTPRFEDPARVRGVRDYQPGDSQRRINWKASAHRDQLLVKQFSPAISLDSMILLNLHAEEYERQRRVSASEWAIVLAASLAVSLEGQRQAVGLAVHGRDSAGNGGEPLLLPPRPGRGHLMKLLETLARVEVATDREPFTAWATRIAAPLSWGTTVLAVLPNGDEATCYGLHPLVRAGLNVVMLVVEPYHRFELVQQRARRLGMSAYAVASEQELDRLQTWRAGIPAPATRGGLAVGATP